MKAPPVTPSSGGDPETASPPQGLNDGVVFRRAQAEDLDAIVRMLADDPLGAGREHYARPLPDGYRRAFEAIAADPNQELVVAHDGEAVVGVLQLTYLPSLTYQGSWRAQIEGVRVRADWRSRGLGRRLFDDAFARASARGCRLVQLTSDKARPDALRFYAQLGFVASHEGLKRPLSPG